MSNETMDRAWRRDEALKYACQDAARSIERVLAQPYRFNDARILALEEARKICANTADHIVRVWD